MPACALLLFWALAPDLLGRRLEHLARAWSCTRAPYKVWFPNPAHVRALRRRCSGRRGLPWRRVGSAAVGVLLGGPAPIASSAASATAAIVTLLCTGAGYVFARMRFRGKQLSFFYIMLMMPLPIWVALISLFFIMSRARSGQHAARPRPHVRDLLDPARDLADGHLRAGHPHRDRGRRARRRRHALAAPAAHRLPAGPARA